MTTSNLPAPTTAAHGLAIRTEQAFWDDKQLAALHHLGVQGASNGDLAVFLHQVQRTGLDPFARQIYMIGRWSKDGTKWTIQTSIDGFRLIGRRAADARRETLEVTDTEWCGRDGVWRDVWLADEPPAAARVAIIRNGGRFPAVALFKEYVQTKRDGSPTQMWQDKGALMIAKCAEALAWRKAFPQDLSGLYTSDEMAQANNHAPAASQAPTPAGPPPPPEPVSMMNPDQSATLARLFNANRQALLDFAAATLARPVENMADITVDEAELLIAAREQMNLRDTQAAAETPGETREVADQVVDAEFIDEATGEVLNEEPRVTNPAPYNDDEWLNKGGER